MGFALWRKASRPPEQLGELGAKPLPIGQYNRELRHYYDNFLSVISRWRSATQLEDPKERERQFERFKTELSVFDALFKHYGATCRELAFNIASALAKKNDVAALTMLAIYAESALGSQALSELKKLTYSKARKIADRAYLSVEAVVLAGTEERAKCAVDFLANEKDAIALHESALMLDSSPEKDGIFRFMLEGIVELDAIPYQGAPIDAKSLFLEMEKSPVLSGSRRIMVSVMLADMKSKESYPLQEDSN